MEKFNNVVEITKWLCGLEAQRNEKKYICYVDLALKSIKDKPLLQKNILNYSHHVKLSVKSKLTLLNYTSDEQDIRLDEDLFELCHNHKLIFDGLIHKQESTHKIPPFMRFNFICDITNCTECGAEYNIQLSYDKREHLDQIFQEYNCPNIKNVADISLWILPEVLDKNQFIFDIFGRETLKSCIIIFCNESMESYFGEYICLINIWRENKADDINDFIKQAEEKFTSLQRLKEKQRKYITESNQLHYVPLEYWIDYRILKDQKFPEQYQFFPFPIGFLISLLWFYNGKLEYEDLEQHQKVKFVIDREEQKTFVLDLKGDEIYLDDININSITGYQEKLIYMFDETINGKYNDANNKIIKNALIFSTDKFSDLVSNPEKMIKFYKFHYDNLLQDKFKEQSEVVKSLVSMAQSMKNTMIKTIDEINKTLINTVFTFLGVILSYVLLYGRSDQMAKDFIFTTVLLITTIYLPINAYRKIHLIGLINNLIQDFYDDFSLVKKIYQLDILDITSIKKNNKSAERNVKNGSLVVLSFDLIFVIGGYIFIRWFVNKYYILLYAKKLIDINTFNWLFTPILLATCTVIVFYGIKQMRIHELHQEIK